MPRALWRSEGEGGTPVGHHMVRCGVVWCGVGWGGVGWGGAVCVCVRARVCVCVCVCVYVCTTPHVVSGGLLLLLQSGEGTTKRLERLPLPWGDFL